MPILFCFGKLLFTLTANKIRTNWNGLENRFSLEVNRRLKFKCNSTLTKTVLISNYSFLAILPDLSYNLL